MNNSNFTINSAVADGDPIRNFGDNSNLSVDSCSFSNNSAVFGDNVYNNGHIDLVSNTMVYNPANIFGNEIYNKDTHVSLNLTYINNATIIIHQMVLMFCLLI